MSKQRPYNGPERRCGNGGTEDNRRTWRYLEHLDEMLHHVLVGQHAIMRAVASLCDDRKQNAELAKIAKELNAEATQLQAAVEAAKPNVVANKA